MLHVIYLQRTGWSLDEANIDPDLIEQWQEGEEEVGIEVVKVGCTSHPRLRRSIVKCYCYDSETIASVTIPPELGIHSPLLHAAERIVLDKAKECLVPSRSTSEMFAGRSRDIESLVDWMTNEFAAQVATTQSAEHHFSTLQRPS